MKSKDIIFAANIKFSEPFLISLQWDAEAFEKFLSMADGLLNADKSLGVPWPRLYGVYTASWNLELKSRVLKDSKKDLVEITANTIDENGNEVHKCIVWYANVLKDDEQHKIRFDKFSTPTTDFMPPGKYNIWTEKDGKYGRKDPFSCGDDGRDKRDIDLFAPK